MSAAWASYTPSTRAALECLAEQEPAGEHYARPSSAEARLAKEQTIDGLSRGTLRKEVALRSPWCTGAPATESHALHLPEGGAKQAAKTPLGSRNRRKIGDETDPALAFRRLLDLPSATAAPTDTKRTCFVGIEANRHHLPASCPDTAAQPSLPVRTFTVGAEIITKTILGVPEYKYSN